MQQGPWQQPPPGWGAPKAPQGMSTGAKVAIALAGLCALCCVGGMLAPKPEGAPAATSSAPQPAEPAANAPARCPEGYGAEIVRRVREDACELGRRHDQCPPWVAAIASVEAECEPGHRSLVVRTVFPTRSDGAAEAARTVGNRAYVAALRDSHGRLPRVRVVAADGNVLCANFDGSAACATSVGEMFGR